MDDVELSELVRRFQALQKDSIADQITERNVVEIVNTLIKKKMVDLLYTTDAKEYMTWDELKREIVEEVHANGGRINVVDIPGLLSVHTYHVERVLPDILASNTDLHQEGGELMTDQYLEATVQSAAEALKEHGSLSVSQFAAKHQFTSAFALQLLTNAVRDGRVSAVIQGSALYTKLFVRSQRVILRSGLLAAEHPVDVEALYKRHGLFAPLMHPLITQLAGELPGTFQGSIYTPAVFESFRTQQVHNIYASNGVVAYSALQSMGITNARQYLVNRYNPGSGTGDGGGANVQPSSSAVHTSAGGSGGGGGRKGGGRRRGGGGGGGGGTATAASPIVRADDEHPHCGYALSACFLSDRYLINLVGLNPLLEGEVLALDIAQLFPVGVDLAKDWAVVAPRLKELYPVVADCQLIEDAVLLRSDAAEKVRPQLVEALRAEASPSAGKKGAKKSACDTSAGPNAAIIIVKTISKALQLPTDQYEAVLREVEEQWSGMIDEVQQQIEATKKNNAAAERKLSRAALQTSMARAWLELVLVAKGLQWAKAELDEATYLTLCRHALATHGLAICRDVILNESLDQAELHAKVAKALPQATTPGSFKNCLAPFPEKSREPLMQLADALNDKEEVSKLLDVLQEMSSGGIIAVSSFHATNKKNERDANANMRATLEAQVSESAFTSDVAANGSLFATLTSLLVAKLFRVYVEVPGKTVSAVAARIARESEAPAALSASLDIVVSSLSVGTVKAEQIAALEELRASVLA